MNKKEIYYSIEQLLKSIYKLRDCTIIVPSDFEKGMSILNTYEYKSLKRMMKERNIKVEVCGKDETKRRRI